MECYCCSKKLKDYINCSFCKNKFCSEPCLSLHSILYHRDNYKPDNEKENIENKNNNCINDDDSKETYKSPYIVKGYLSMEIEYDPIYGLKNFSYEYFNGKPKLIGYGSFGRVYLGKNIFDKKFYAIKHMEKKSIYKALHSLDSIYDEIKIQSQINHPNILKILYVNETEKTFDLILEYASKGNLFFYIQKYRSLSESKSFQIFIQIVNAIYFLHKNNFIHRDIKPENILLFDNNLVKLCDFGWCAKINDKPRNTFCGTTEYMAPEMVNEKNYGKEIDAWSLGILLYEMLHGNSPFKPRKLHFTDKDVINNIKRQKSIVFNNNLSYECIELIKHLIEKNISKRYSVEDIFYSNFVKNFEKLNYFFPPKNIAENNYSIDKKNDKINSIDKNSDKINSNDIIESANKSAKNFYPKYKEDLKQKKLIDFYDSNKIINDEESQRKNDLIKENKTLEINKQIYLPINKKHIEIKRNNTNFDYINKNKVTLSPKNIKNIKFTDGLLNNKIIQKKEEEEEKEDIKDSNSFRKSCNNNYNFNNYNIFFCNNIKDLSQLNNNFLSEKDDFKNNFIINDISDNNNNKNNTIDIIKENNLKLNNSKRNKVNINCSTDLINSSVKYDDDSNNLIIKRIKIFNHRNSNIREIQKSGQNKYSILNRNIYKNYNEPNLFKTNNTIIRKNDNLNIFNKSLKDKNKGIKYEKQRRIKIKEKRNTSPFTSVQNIIINQDIDNYRNIKYKTIENKPDLTHKRYETLKAFLKILNNNKISENDNKIIFDESINKNTNNNKINEEVIKTPKKIEDKMRIKPQIFLEKFKKELKSFNENIIFK